MGKRTAAYVGPFLTFMLFVGLSGMLEGAHMRPWGVDGMYLVYPIQTLVCAGVLGYYWKEYRMGAPRKAWVAVVIGVVVFGLWVAREYLPHQEVRLGGFDPEVFAGQPGVYRVEVVLRFVRLALVVPLLEEIFWRGFLLRYLVNEDFERVEFGTYTMKSNVFVAVAFMMEHGMADWPAALAAGFLYNMVAYRTKSLPACALAHGITNALLGVWIMRTAQWGFW